MFADAAVSRAWRQGAAGLFYVGDDHCTVDGARRLAERLTSYWERSGNPRKFEIYRVDYRQRGSEGEIYGVREVHKRCSTAPKLSRFWPLIQTPRQRIYSIVRETLKQFPDVPYDAIVLRGKPSNYGKRPSAETHARRACLVAVKAAYPSLSYPQLGEIFGIDHSAVYYQLNEDFREHHRLEGRKRQHRATRLKVAA